MTKTIIHRSFSTELRHRTEGDTAVIEGYGNKFNTYSQNLGGFVEEVLPGAFKNSIDQKSQSDKADIRGTYNHDLVVARQHNQTLQLHEDRTGLYYEMTLNLRISAHRDLYESIDTGIVNGSSFGFSMLDYEWAHTNDDFPLLRQKTVELFDVGPVDFPAYLDTDADAQRALYRSFAEAYECTDIECFVSRAEQQLAESRKFNLSNLIAEAQPVAATPLLDAARNRAEALRR